MSSFHLNPTAPAFIPQHLSSPKTSPSPSPHKGSKREKQRHGGNKRAPQRENRNSRNQNRKSRGRETQEKPRTRETQEKPKRRTGGRKNASSSSSKPSRTSSSRPPSPLTRDHFLQTRCKAVLDPFCNADQPYLSNPSIPPTWENINHVEFTSHTAPTCPICLLEPPEAMRMSRCGHFFCICCVLRLCEEDIASCPICKAIIIKPELKPAKFNQITDVPEEGSVLSFRLLGLQKYSLAPFLGAEVPPHRKKQVDEDLLILQGHFRGVPNQSLLGHQGHIPFDDLPEASFSRYVLGTPTMLIERLQGDLLAIRRVREEVEMEELGEERSTWLEVIEEANTILREEEKTWMGGLKMREARKKIAFMKRRLGLSETEGGEEEEGGVKAYLEQRRQQRERGGQEEGRSDTRGSSTQNGGKRKDAWDDEEDGCSSSSSSSLEGNASFSSLFQKEDQDDAKKEEEEGENTPGGQGESKEEEERQVLPFFQLSNGLNVFLHPLILECLQADSSPLPEQLEGRVIEMSSHTVSPSFLRKYPFLSHLPPNTPVQLAEIEGVREMVSKKTWAQFKHRFQSRGEWRRRRREREGGGEGEGEGKRIDEEERERSQSKMREVVEKKKREKQEAIQSLNEGPSLVDEEYLAQRRSSNGSGGGHSPPTESWSFSRIAETGGYFPELGK